MTAGSSSKTIGAIRRLRQCFTRRHRTNQGLYSSSFALLCRRLRALGIDPRIVALSHPDVYMSLADVCASCSKNRRCLDDMADGDQVPGWESYCPNVSTLRTLH